MPITTTKPKTLGEVCAYIESPHFNPYNFGEYLKALGESINNTLNRKTLLGIAVQKLNVPAVEKLLECGADPKVLTRCLNVKGDVLELPPIYWAAYSGPASDVSLDLTARVKIIDAILSKASYEDVNIPEHPLMAQTSNPMLALQLLIHGASTRSEGKNEHIREALTMLVKKIDTPENCLAIQQLHPDTVKRLEGCKISLDVIQHKAIQAIKNGAVPYKIGDKYTAFTQAALDAIEKELDGMPPLADTSQVSYAGPVITSNEDVKKFLHMSLHPDTKSYLVAQDIDFSKFLESAVDKILKEGFDPLMEKSDVFTENAIAAITKVQAKLAADPTLLLYSNIHANSFVSMGDEVTGNIKLSAIDKLKSGAKPKDGEKELTSHAQELIDYIALEAKSNVARWLAIKALDQETKALIDTALKTIDSSIDILNQEILMRLKNGEDLGLKSDPDFVLVLTPNTQETITALCKQLESNPTLLLHVRLADQIKDLVSKAHKGGMDHLITKAMNTLIAKKDATSDGNFAKYTDMLSDILTSDPKQLLYLKDWNVTKICSDLGKEKFATIEKLVIKAIKQGASSKWKDNPLTPFATKLFNEIIDSIKVINIKQRDSEFTKDGISALREFAAGSPEVLEYINRLEQHLFPEESASWSFWGWLPGITATAPAKPAATEESNKPSDEKVKTTNTDATPVVPLVAADAGPIVPLATTDEAAPVVPFTGDGAAPADA